MMEFTFTDYTFSGLLSILAALYGVGYPLIIQSIEKISAQYNSDNISERFTKEGIYLVFQGLLILNMAFAITTPFLLHADWNNVLFLTLQAVLLVLLVGQTFLLFNLILKYSNGPQLLRHIEGRQVDKNNVFQIFDLAVYADANHLYPLYLDCMADIFGYIQAQQGDEPGQDLNLVLPPPKYNQETIDLVRKIRGFLREDDGHHYLYRQNDIVAAFYNQTSRSRIGQQTRQIMWNMANDTIAYNNKAWFSQYWQFADSYANIRYHYICYEHKELEADKYAFIEQHVMLGTALVHWKRYDWLNDIFFYTHSEPEYYGLIPSIFAHIMQVLRRLERQCNNPLVGGWKYYFTDSMAGATDEKHIFRESVRYLALLVIRLWSMQNRNLIEYRDVFMTPAFPLLLSDATQEINVLAMMKADVNEWMNRGVFDVMPGLAKVDGETVKAFIEEYRSECEQDLNERKKHPTVNLKKFQELCRQLEKEVETLEARQSDGDDYQNGTSITTEVRGTYGLETLNYSGYIQIDCRCVPNVHCTNFWNEIACDYLRCLERQKRLGDYTVPRKQLTNVLSSMGLNEDYAVIATERIEELPKSAVLLHALRRVKWFFVVRKGQVPYIKLIPVGDLKPVRDGGKICSNIEEFQGCRKPVFGLSLATKVSFSIPQDFVGYVRFTIDDTYEAQNAKINPKQTFDELFGKEENENDGPLS